MKNYQAYTANLIKIRLWERGSLFRTSQEHKLRADSTTIDKAGCRSKFASYDTQNVR